MIQAIKFCKKSMFQESLAYMLQLDPPVFTLDLANTGHKNLFDEVKCLLLIASKKIQ